MVLRVEGSDFRVTVMGNRVNKENKEVGVREWRLRRRRALEGVRILYEKLIKLEPFWQ